MVRRNLSLLRLSFFQTEDGIRDLTVTGVQTCALPIWLADGAARLREWSEMLAALAQVSRNEQLRAVIADPNLPAAKAAGLFITVLTGRLTGEAENFVRVLADNGRLD